MHLLSQEQVSLMRRAVTCQRVVRPSSGDQIDVLGEGFRVVADTAE